MDYFHLFLNSQLNKHLRKDLKDYKVVKGTLFPPNAAIISFEKEMKEWARLGYIPCGCFSITKSYENGMVRKTTLYQAMCRYSVNDD